MTIDTLKQAAQALRDTKPELAAALGAMAGDAAMIEAWKVQCLRLIDCFNDLMSPTIPEDSIAVCACLNALVAHVSALKTSIGEGK